MKILDGNKIANKETKTLKKEFSEIAKLIDRKAIISIIQVGNCEASNRYIKYKMKKAEELGVDAILHRYPNDMRPRDLLKKLDKINEHSDGIIVQLPLPEQFSTQVILDSVRHEKDIDGLSTRNSFNFYNDVDDFHFIPATALGILDLIKSYKINLQDMKTAVVGRSNLVGKPVAFLIKKEGANVSTYTKNSGIKGVENADLVIVATGVKNLLSKDQLKEKSIVIDVGSNWIEQDGKMVCVGDVDVQNLDKHISALAPVPGGVGPMTVISLFKNLAKAIRHNHQI